ncbi:Sugar transporter [Spraguea lophii 42_110]|uniref:Sugar transporter n=1 Tax=Spraguea lophii (strain 42_110) TaxID=1358809 RepID=S7XJS0_SPRLO|nr:Sugar transporter [Spraguea lophii 42_110]
MAESLNLKNSYSIIVGSFTSLLFGLNIPLNILLEKGFKKMIASNKKKYIFSADKLYNIMGSSLLLGAFIGSFLPNALNLKGKKGVISCYFIYFTGFLVYMLLNSPYICILGRFLSGIAVGICSNITVPYLLEISPANIRGVIGSTFQLMIVTGIFATNFVNFLIGDKGNIDNIILIILSSSSLILGCLAFLIQNISISEDENEKGIRDLFNNVNSKRSILYSLILHLAQQFSGINGLMMFSSSLFEKTGNSSLYTMILGLVNLISTVLVMFMIDKFGRKSLLISSSVISIIGYLIILLKFSMIWGIYTYIFGFAIGLGPAVWIVGSEIVPKEYVTASNSLIVPLNWLSGFLISFSFEPLYKQFGRYSFIFYIVMMLFFLCFVILRLPETRGKPRCFIK